VHRIDLDGVTGLHGQEGVDALNMLCTVDLRSVVDEASDDCWVNKIAAQHYIAPSGEHCERFFRLGNAIRTRSALERLAFWATRVLSSAGAVVIDNWSIAAVALRALQVSQRDIPFDCLTSHPKQSPQDAKRIIKQIVGELGDSDGDLLFLVSVTSSGAFAEIVRGIAELFLPPDRIRIVALYGLSGTPDDVERLYTLALDPKNTAAEECSLCASGSSTAIPLDPSLYYAKVYPEVPVPLKRDHFVQKDFAARFGAVPSVFKLHHTDAYGRHHGFYVSVPDMLIGDAEYAKKSRKVFEDLPHQYELLVTHSAPSAIAKIAREVLDIPMLVTDSLQGLNEADTQTFSQARRILVVSDLMISGHSMERYVKALREKPFEPTHIGIVIGLARPVSEAALTRAKTAWTKNVSWETHFEPIETFCLPNWSKLECPWCAEFEWLDDAIARTALPPRWATDRLQVLQSISGIAEPASPLFLLPDSIPRVLGNGSVAGSGGASALTITMSIASGLQFLRNEKVETSRLVPVFPLHHVMSAEKNLGNYSEALLRAILLRTVAPKEWGITERRRATEYLAALPNDADREFLSGELLLWVARTNADRSPLAEIYMSIAARHSDFPALFPRPIPARPASRLPQTRRGLVAKVVGVLCCVLFGRTKR
jgi:hypothetical protein